MDDVTRAMPKAKGGGGACECSRVGARVSCRISPFFGGGGVEGLFGGGGSSLGVGGLRVIKNKVSKNFGGSN